MEDELALEYFYFTLGASLGVLLTYPLLYHGYFVYCGFISKVCKEINTILYFLRAYARKLLLF
jgi:hypothetical protein